MNGTDFHVHSFSSGFFWLYKNAGTGGSRVIFMREKIHSGFFANFFQIVSRYTGPLL